MNPSSNSGHAAAAEAAECIRSILQRPPKIGILTGTGLGEAVSGMADPADLDYRHIPHFPMSTVATHRGRLIAGEIGGQDILLMQGRFHLYEGYSPAEVTFPVRVMQALGIRTLILTNASGGLNPLFASGQIMVIKDHINLTGDNPLVGPNEARWGRRFPQMIHAYDSRLAALALSTAQRLGIAVQHGVYAGLKGPSLETPAEMRFLHTIGAEAVGFSTVMETIAAVHAGMQVLGLSVITNMCLPDALATADVGEIIAVAQATAPDLGSLIEDVIGHLGEGTR